MKTTPADELALYWKAVADGWKAEAARLARQLVPPPELATCAAQLPLPLASSTQQARR